MTLFPLLKECAQAPNRNIKKISFLPYKRKKTLKAGDLMKNRAGATTVAEKILGPLDLARADPTAEINSQYRNWQGHGGGVFNIRMFCDMAIAKMFR